jgi:hypothetical protein
LKNVTNECAQSSGGSADCAGSFDNRIRTDSKAVAYYDPGPFPEYTGRYRFGICRMISAMLVA